MSGFEMFAHVFLRDIGCIQNTVAFCFLHVMFEMSPVIYVNKYYKMTSATPLPAVPDLPEDPVA